MSHATLVFEIAPHAGRELSRRGMLACALAIATVFTADVLTPLGISFAFLYVPILWAALLWANHRQVMVMAAACTLLTILAPEFGPDGDLRVDVINRAIVLTALWFLVYFGSAYRRMVDTLQTRENELADFIENAAVGMHWLERGGTIVWANTEQLDMLGYASDEFVGRNIAEFHVDEAVSGDILDKCGTEVELRDYPARFRHKDGSVRDLLIATSFQRKKGAIIQVRCFTRDITDRRRAEQAERKSDDLAAINDRLQTEISARKQAQIELEEAERRYRELVASVPAIVWRADAHTFQFNFVSRQAETILGYPVRRWLDEPGFWTDHLHPEDSAAAVAYCVKATSELRAHDFEYRMIAADGRTVWLRDLVQVEAENGQARELVGVMVDITDQKEAEKKLRDSEDLLRMTFDLAPDGIAIIGPDGRFLNVNAAYRRLVGYTGEELRHVTAMELTHEDDRSRNLTLRDELRAGRRDSYELEKRYRTKDGRLIWVRAKISAVRDDHGNLRFTVGITHDISEQKRAERILLESEEHYRHLFEMNPMPMWITRTDTLQVAAVNDAAVQQYGYTRGEFERMTAFDFQPPDGLAAYEALVTQRRPGEPTAYRRTKHCRKDGGIIDVDVTSHPITYAGAPARLVLAHDVTERLRAEAALREREELLRVTFDAAPMGINIVSLEGRFIRANAAYEKLVGYTEEELRAMTTFDLNHPDDIPRNRTLRAELLAGKRDFYEIEKRYRTREGNLVWVRNRVRLVKDALGYARFTVAAVQDITERRQAERELQRQAALSDLLESLAAAANKAATPDQALAACLERICAYGGWNCGDVLRIVRHGDAWRATGTQWHFTDERDRERFSDFIRLLQEKSLNEPDGAFVNRLIRTRVARWISDLDQTRCGPRLTCARHAGVRAAFAFPVIVHDEVVACVEFFATEVREPDAALLEAIGNVASHLARVIERDLTGEVQAHLAAIVETSPDAIMSRSPDGTILSWNPGAERLFGYRAAEVVGKKAPIIPEDCIEETRRNRELVNAGHVLAQFETARITRDGRRIQVAISVAPIRDAAGNVYGAATIIRDITERKRAEEALRRSEEQFLRMFHSSPIAISISTVHDGRFIDVNDRFLEFSGYRRDEVIGRTGLERGMWIEPERRSELMNKLLEGESVRNVELRFRRKSGEIATVLYSKEILQLGNRPVSFTMRVDITERKRAEQELQRRTALAELLEALARAVNESTTPEAAVQACLQRMCAYGGWALGHFALMPGWEVGDKQHSSIWHVPPDAERYAELMRRGDDVVGARGGHGRFAALAIREKKPVWLADISQIGGLSRLRLAAQAALRSVFGFPVFVGDEVMAFVEFFAADVRDPDDALIAAAGSIAAQLTRLVERDRAFRATARLAAIVETATVAIITRTLDGTILSWNPGAEKMLGYTAAEVTGKHIASTLPPGRPPNLARNNESLLRGEVVARESDRMTRDGRVIDVLTSHSPIRDSAGNVVGASVILQDITALKQAQTAVRNSERRLRTIIDNVPMLIGYVDAAQRMQFVNKAYEDWYGIPMAECPGRTVREVVGEERYRELEPEIKAALAGQVVSSEKRTRVRHREQYVQITYHPDRNPTGHVRGFYAFAYDVTERRKAAEALAAERNLLRSVMDTVPDSLFVKDREGRYLLLNNMAMRVRGIRNLSEGLGRKVGEFHAAELAASLEEEDCQVLASGDPIVNRERMFMLEGKQCCMLRTKVPLRDADGKIIGLIGIARDVTELRRAHEALRTSEARFRAIFEHAGVGIAVRPAHARDSAWIEVNERLCEMLGYTREELLQLSTIDITPPDERDTAIEYNERLLRGELSSYTREKHYMRKNGESFWGQLSLSVVHGPEDRPMHVIAAIQDITAARNTAERIRESEERFRTIFDHAPSGIAQSDAFDYRFTAVNPAFARMLGYAQEEMIGMPASALAHPAEPVDIKENRERMLRGDLERVAGEHRLLRKDGSVIWVNRTVVPVRSASGEPRHFIGVYEDITERKAAETGLRDYSKRLQMLSRKVLEAQENERASVARELHDQLGQTLSAAKLNLQVFQRHHKDVSFAASLKDAVDTVDQALQQVRTLALDLRPPQLDDLGLSTTLRSYAERLAKPARLKLHFSASELPALPPQIDIACFRVAQGALTNVIRHAQASHVWVALEVERNMLSLRVRDDGNGCDLKHAQRQALRGHSMGLLSMEERTLLAGGRFLIKSEPGAGMEVHADFPVVVEVLATAEK
ncbi:MAG: PAS domain S-box protein [Betaproteobacteria bacterium]|nr:PAS domain S-box protein [Betaproteobacteria bacterium]